MASAKVYELLPGAGVHSLRGEDGDGNAVDVKLQPGEQVKSKKNLVLLHPNKFVCVDDTIKNYKVKPPPADEPVRPTAPGKRDEALANDLSDPEETADADLESEDDEVEDELDADKFGRDVTEDVDGAAEKDLKVFLKDKHYLVFDAGDAETPVTDKPMTKGELTKFLKKYAG